MTTHPLRACRLRPAPLLGAMALLFLGSGCLSAQKYLNYPFLHVEYRKHGVAVWDIRQRFEYDALSNTETLSIYRDLVLIDTEADGRVDEVRSNGQSFRRGETGTEELFRRADARWSRVRKYLLASWFRSRRSGMLKEDPGRIVPGLDS